MSERAHLLDRLRAALARAPLPPTLASVDRALRIPVVGGDEAWTVVVRAVGGTLAAVDGTRVAALDVPELSTALSADELVGWCTDPDQLLGELVDPEDLAGDRLFLVSCFDGLVGAVKGAAGRGRLSA